MHIVYGVAHDKIIYDALKKIYYNKEIGLSYTHRNCKLLKAKYVPPTYTALVSYSTLTHCMIIMGEGFRFKAILQ